MFEIGKRYSGYFDFNVRCPIIDDRVISMKIPILFSFKVIDVEDGSIRVSAVNPMAVRKLLSDGQTVFLVGDSFRKKIVAKTIFSETLSFNFQKTVIDKRKDFRYKFCPSLAGSFELYRNGIAISSHIFLESLSFSGLSSFIFLKDVKISKGDTLLLVQDAKRFKISVVSSESKPELLLVRGKIISSNVNVFKLNIDLYLKTFKYIMSLVEGKVGRRFIV